MIRQRVSFVAVSALVATTALTAGLATSASAAPTIYDPGYTPGTTDLVGVGSDTSEIALDYLSKGHTVDGVLIKGFNADKTTSRIASFAAGMDTPTVVLREGAAAITRPNGSGAGKTLLRPATTNADVDFARSSSTLSPAEISDDLQQSPFAVDGLKLAVSSSLTNAPASISAVDMVKIYNGTYTNWSELPGSTKSGVIKPLIPQAGSGTRSFFVARLKAANGGVDVVLGGNVASTQEHSDTDIKDNPNAVAPFSTGRAKGAPTVATLGGFSAQRALYNVVRKVDLNGPRASLINAAFDETGFACSTAARPLIEAAGFDQLASTSRGGACGDFVQTDVTNFKTSGDAADATTTTLKAVPQNGGNVVLTALVDSAAGFPVGSVSFKEGDTEVANVAAATGTATVTLSGVGVGSHTYTATLVPTDSNDFKPSSSTEATAKVLQSSKIAVTVSSSPRTYGVVRTVTVKATSNGGESIPSGNVVVKVGALPAAKVALANGVGSVKVPATARVGNNVVTATYAQTAMTFGTTTRSTLAVSKAKTTSVAKLSAKKVKASKRAKATITVTITGASASVKAGGKVVLKAGKKTVGTGTVKNGKVTITLKKLKKGTYKIKATFAGTSNYTGSSAKILTLKVTK